MANTARGGYTGASAQFPAYAASQYYSATQQQYQAYSYPFYAHDPAAGAPTHPHGYPPNQQVPRQPPPPPPPPPGESSPVSTASTGGGNSTSMSSMGGTFPPLERPPLPPLFPWMTPTLAQSMTGSQYGQNFKEEASNLPFVPIMVNDADLQKMTEKLIKEAEEETNHQMKFYKDVISQDLPKPLLDLFQPLYCKLCILSLSSPVVAKDHYSGKRHKKAIEVWFSKNQVYSQSNEPMQDSTTGVAGITRPVVNGFVSKSQAPQAQPPVAPPMLQSHQLSGRGNFQQQQQLQNIDRKRPTPPDSMHHPSSAMNQGPPPRQFTQNASQIRPQNPGLAHIGGGQGNANPNNMFVGHNGPRQQVHPVNQGPSRAPNQSQSQDGDFQLAKKARWEGPPAPGPSQPSNNLGERLRVLSQGGGGGGGGPPPKDRCEMCNVQLSSKVMAEQHFRGKNHAARLAALKEQGAAGSTNSGASAMPSLLTQQIPPPASSGSAVIPPSVQQPTSGPPSTLSHRGGASGGGRGGGPGRGGARPTFNNNSTNFQNSNNFNNNSRNNNNRFGNNNNKRGGGPPRFK